MFTRLYLTIAAAAGLAVAADSPDAKPASGSAAARVPAARPATGLPPVLRPIDPQDSVLVQLPGPVAPAVRPQAQPQPAAASAPPVVPVAPPAPVAPKPMVARRPFVPVEQVAVHRPAAIPALPPAPALRPANHFDTPAILQPPKKTYPADFERDSALYCQRRIGDWKESDARELLGDPIRTRPAFDDDDLESGRIYAFPDPTGQYKEMELDFAKDSGLLRTVFVYPLNLTWVDCRRLWGTNVSAAQANKGRKFYSYMNRRLDVLVDPAGKVISLGLY